MMRGVVVVVFGAGAACFSKPPPPNSHLDGRGGDSGSDGSMPIDASGPCAMWGEFDPTLTVVSLPTDVSGITEPTLSSDGTDLMFVSGGFVSESVRDAMGEFSSDALVLGAGPITTAWLSPNRLTLYGVDSGHNLVKLTRTALTGPFQDGGNLFGGVQDAAWLTGEKQVIFSTPGGALEFGDYTQGALMTSPLLNDAYNDFSPSVGDYDRTVVWSRVNPALPMISELWQGRLNFNNIIDQEKMIGLPPADYYSGAILSHDGATLYFTAKATPNNLYSTKRPCMGN